MDFHIVKMYKDKVSTKMSKIFFLSMCDVKMFLTFTSLSLALTDKISQQPENCEPDLVQAFLKKWWVESDFKAPNPPPFITAQSFRLSL
jgi:hypothetical protein